MLYLMGPVGSGKSSLVEQLQRGLEESAAGLRNRRLPDERGAAASRCRATCGASSRRCSACTSRATLCPVCRYPPEGGVRHDATRRSRSSCARFSKRNRVGIGVVPPVDPNNQDTSVLIGSEDISKLDLYSEGDPRVLDLNGALNVGNRGMVEFIEVFKNETEYLHAMITATQEKVIPAPGRHGMVYVDTGHRRPLERGGVAEVQGRPHQRGDPRPHRRGEGAVQPAALRRGEDLPEDHPPLGLPRPRRAAHARGGVDVRDPLAPRADARSAT